MRRVILLGLVILCLISGCEWKISPQETDPSGVSPSSVSDSGPSGSAWQTHPTTAPTEPSTQPSSVPPEEPEEDAFVRVSQYIPDIVVDLKYATTENFVGKVIYGFSDVYLRYGTVKKLMLVQQTLREQGLSLKIWDGYRPVYAQWRLWEACPDATYVSDPNKGYSSHCRGNTVDITLVDSQGQELDMPTGFDDFSKLADRDYSDCSPEAAKNATMLQELMYNAGFRGYSAEWWHFTDLKSYDVEHTFDPAILSGSMSIVGVEPK